MVACALTGNISGEATTPPGNILGEAMRHLCENKVFARTRESLDGVNSISNWQITSLVSSCELAIESSCGRYRPKD
jgi:hypothetical protein